MNGRYITAAVSGAVCRDNHRSYGIFGVYFPLFRKVGENAGNRGSNLQVYNYLPYYTVLVQSELRWGLEPGSLSSGRPQPTPEQLTDGYNVMLGMCSLTPVHALVCMAMHLLRMQGRRGAKG